MKKKKNVQDAFIILPDDSNAGPVVTGLVPVLALRIGG